MRTSAIDSPNFRPASGTLLDGDDEQSQDASNLPEGDRKRKSIGRRVSFAPTAKVRFIDPDRENVNAINSPQAYSKGSENFDKEKCPERNKDPYPKCIDDVFNGPSGSP